MEDTSIVFHHGASSCQKLQNITSRTFERSSNSSSRLDINKGMKAKDQGQELEDEESTEKEKHRRGERRFAESVDTTSRRNPANEKKKQRRRRELAYPGGPGLSGQTRSSRSLPDPAGWAKKQQKHCSRSRFRAMVLQRGTTLDYSAGLMILEVKLMTVGQPVKYLRDLS
ncbi:hypothetical protein Sjap_015307 [Stephania japonica]|uniref:Uncharacterized protein n=1 Tax=Stephania japonica TaxID=461633 RepID=A0AAP0IJB9_9MAGN